ncbi:fatty acid cis/trans isomerase [Bdellovibrio svalbardensis]|uniref:Fatty acid cis/trans isomerase n=1 Tax=Bdellovibrio svalbardensis TaxID=2972972 RepID=A0ABT6DQF9_9BACT|nr:fatty acid cis/trans isomerase [Bdellovibrio svalbardensis]MDG0817383.1 fatty acid cis/trans isomerase [Bdellovibrio svalbardensis]
MQFIKILTVCFISVVMAGVFNAPALAQEPNLDFYTQRVQPIFNNRCLSCHSCFNAPCQLNLQNFDGFARGASNLNVYNGSRLKAVEPTRMWVDAKSTEAWRKKGFFDVHTSNQPNLDLFFSMVNLRSSKPRASISKGVAESQVCAANMLEFKVLELTAPELGMPYGLPPIASEDLAILENWVKNGAQGPTAETKKQFHAISSESLKQVREWEGFFNRDDLRQKLVSRYLYEHLFLAHIYFPNSPREFFRLVRSSTACDKGVEEIATRRPNDDPGVRNVFYCLQKFPGTIVMKTHLPYEWNPEKMKRYQELFFSGNWTVSSLPNYKNSVAENPFIAFKDIPVKARYQFLLDDAQYEVATFIKGPVCNGSQAVNSIQEQFYTFFLSPDADNMVLSPDYEKKANNLLILPGMWGSDIELLDTPLFLKKLVDYREAYRKLRVEELKKVRPEGYSLKDIWDGDGNNPNAVLTVFRHDQNAVVMKGAVGDLSKTAFVLDYPLLERLVYNLVVNFDVFGNVSHQLLTRDYMDLIRMEAEELFLMFLPPEQRITYRRAWYQGLFASAKMNYIFPTVGFSEPTGIRYTDPNKTKKQFVEKILFYRMNEKVRGSLDALNWKNLELPESLLGEFKATGYDAEFRRIASVPASSKPFAQFFPDVAYVMVKGKTGTKVYSLIHNKEHENISWITGESLRMAPQEDTLTFREGYWASYPNMIFTVNGKDLKKFVDKISGIKSDKEYQALVDGYGVRRQNPKFWVHYDELNKVYRDTNPVNFGYLDLTRYDL